jgi:DNA polymerase
MRFVTLDFETEYSDDYTLSNLTTEAYIRDPRFKALGAAIKWRPQEDPIWYDEPKLRQVLKDEDWSDVALICHHSHFDGLILAHHYGVRPRLHVCTLSMARLLIGNHLSVALSALAKYYQLEAKSVPYNLFKGKHWAELTPAEQELLAAGCCHDVELTWQVFATLSKQFPREEFEVVDTTVRMFTEPVLRADVPMLKALWNAEAANKKQSVEALGVTDKQLGSNAAFAALLEAEGITVQMKPGKNGDIYAFAKTDEFMEELLDDDNDRVRALAQARLGIKSSLLQTRCETLGYMANRGPLCVYLRYAGAHTSRWSGGDKSNFQNAVPKLNAAIMAPEGYLIASPDASQIECRVLNYLAGQSDVVEAFRAGRDVYAEKASAFYGRKITRADTDERQMFKVVELQAGYGSGASKIKATMRIKAGLDITDEFSEELKQSYRSQHPFVTAYWRQADEVLKVLASGGSMQWGPCRIENKRIILPNGIPLIYDTLEWHTVVDTGETYWRIRTRNGWVKMYGAKLVENVIQALARVVVSQAMLRIRKLGYKIFNMRHDDIGVLIPGDGKEQRHLLDIIDEMRKPVSWLPGCPLDAEGSLNERYVKS